MFDVIHRIMSLASRAPGGIAFATHSLRCGLLI